MATNLNNIHINSFTKGMNTDTSLDMVSNELYVFGKNIRITKNTLVYLNVDSNTKEGTVTPIYQTYTFDSISSIDNMPFDKILASASIGDTGVVVIKSTDSLWCILKLTYNGDEIESESIYKSNETTDANKFDIVLNKEQEGVFNVYLTDGKNPMMCINIEDPEYYKGISVKYLSSDVYFPRNKAKIVLKIQGRLKTSQILYVYRFYKRHSIKSKLSPITNKIQVIDGTRSKEIGNAQDTITNIGFKILIDIDDDARKIFDHVLLYRIQYISTEEGAKIQLIYDGKFTSSDKYVQINDSGLDALADISVDEFAGLDSMNIIPTCIELNQNHMFAANIKDETKLKIDADYDARAFSVNSEGWCVYYKNDDTTYTTLPSPMFHADDLRRGDFYNNLWTLNKSADMATGDGDMFDIDGYYGGTGPNISWRFITTNIPIASDVNFIPQYNNDRQAAICYIKKDGTLEQIGEMSTNDILVNQGLCKSSKLSYDDMLISSMFRSLKRDEVYRYGIVFYNSKGLKSEVQWIADIKTPSANVLNGTSTENIPTLGACLYSRPIGVEFKVNNYPNDDIVGYQIVRCAKPDHYTKNLLLVVLARPVRQELYTTSDRTKNRKYSPYYPSFYLTSQYQQITTSEVLFDNTRWYKDNATSKANDTLFQAFSPLHQTSRQDLLSRLGSLNLYLKAVGFMYGKSTDDDGNNIGNNAVYSNLNVDVIKIYRDLTVGAVKIEDKTSQSYLFFDYNYKPISGIAEILNIEDVKNPLWEQGFSNIQLSGSDIQGGTKQYKSFDTSIGQNTYVNWIANAMYDFRLSEKTALSGFEERDYVFIKDTKDRTINAGWIGPGPVCMLIDIKNDNYGFGGRITVDGDDLGKLRGGVIIANIINTPTQFAGLTNHDKQYDVYYGFGNYYSKDAKSCCVFDGDVYNVPCEVVSMYKTYNFNSADTLPSAQLIYYIPLETTINTCFDYGMNYRNTLNKTLQLEPGEITGITSQDRPQYQYNAIYSDNNRSNDMFTVDSLEDNEDIYTQRIYYSELKTNGENIDSWLSFKPVDYIDADTRYGDITHLLTVKDIIYYWQEHAFGKLSVNERSLVTDTNSNTILLGQGGVLQRVDYINTKYGMRKEDHCAIDAEGVVFWIDILNKAIVQSNGQSAINYAEASNVQNVVNENISTEIPTIHYDVENNELLCKCLKDGEQLVFNLKLNCATSVYNRKYNDIINIHRTLVGLDIKNIRGIRHMQLHKYNNINDNEDIKYMPTVLSFVVNPNSSITKVFDNQEIVLQYNSSLGEYPEDKKYFFSTNITKKFESPVEGYTSREGNFKYPIPRIKTDKYAGYGDRVRGKWMTVDIHSDNPNAECSISHILTKFRQSFS